MVDQRGPPLRSPVAGSRLGGTSADTPSGRVQRASGAEPRPAASGPA